MELRNQENSMGIPTPSSLRFDGNQIDQDSASKRTRIDEDTVFNPSPDRKQSNKQQHQSSNSRPRRDPDPNRIGSIPEPSSINTEATTTIRYRECQKNHAAHLGSHVVDGCGEFMPDGAESTPAAMRCAACGCHRNFHRKEADDGGRDRNCYISFGTSKQIVQAPHTATTTPAIFQAPSIHHHHHPTATMMAFGGGIGAHAESSSDDLNLFRSDGDYGTGSSKKRFRTKFTAEQKDRMMEFAEKIEWRIQKQDEEEVQHFCAMVGVKRQVFKVWMHNNKQASKRRQSDNSYARETPLQN